MSKNIYTKLAEVSAAIDNIPKNGYNEYHGYHYASEADVSNAIRKELTTRGVALLVSTKIREVREWVPASGKPTMITLVDCELTFADGESGESVTITAVGAGDDSSDKGVYKAITGAVKYSLLKTFLVPTGDDPEQHATTPAPVAATPVKQWPENASDKGVQAVAEAFNTTPTPAADTSGFVFKFGKYKGKGIDAADDNYLQWLLKQPAKEGYEKKHAEDQAVYRSELERRGVAA